MKPLPKFKRLLRAFNLPTLSLLALLQRTPVVQAITAADEFVMSSPIGTVLRSFAAIAASLGAMNSLAGATPLVPSSGSATGTTVTVGTAVSIAYTVNGTQTPPASWTISGPIPPGLDFSGLTSSGTVNVSTLQLKGTPTTAGTYMVTIQTFQFTSGGGVGSPVYDYTITVTGSSATAPSFTTQPQSRTANAGTNVSFTVAASGSPAPTLQWKKGTTTLTGQTGTTLTLNNVQSADAGSYTCVATNTAGSATSNTATLTVDTAPGFTTQPQSQTVNAGMNVSFTVAASGSPAPTLQWKKGTTTLTGETATTLTLSNVQAADAGDYTCVATNTAGSATSTAATLTVNTVTLNPPSTPARAGAYASGPTEVTITWQPPASGTAATGYEVDRALDSAFTQGMTMIMLSTTSTSYIDLSAVAGTTYYYRVAATNADGASTPTNAIMVTTPASAGTGTATFVNISTRAYCSTGNSVTIGGYVVSGHTPKHILIRAVGPSLSTQGIAAADTLADPTISLHHGATVVATNDNWTDNGNGDTITTTGAQVGAQPIAASDTTSAALAITLDPGVYSFVVNGKGGTSGIVLLEIYDADDVPGATSPFVNISSRAYASTGNGVTIGGFVISGHAPKRVLVRAVGPTLTTQGIASGEVLADPVIELHHGATVIATNDNWSDNDNAADIVTTGARIGASPLDQSDTKSAALLLTLPAGAYSFVASGKGGTSGIVLVEVYDAD